jgi:hypothetical protein
MSERENHPIHSTSIRIFMETSTFHHGMRWVGSTMEWNPFNFEDQCNSKFLSNDPNSVLVSKLGTLPGETHHVPYFQWPSI